MNQSTLSQGRILKSAVRVFSQQGFRGGTLAEIARGADMTKAGVLHHYPSKEAVLLALLARRDEDLRLFSPKVTGNRTLAGLFDDIISLMPSILADEQLVRLSHVLTAEAAHPDHPAHKWVRERHALVRSTFAGVITTAQAHGEVNAKVDPTILGSAILALIEGAEAQWLVNLSRLDVQAVLRLAFDALLATTGAVGPTAT